MAIDKIIIARPRGFCAGVQRAIMAIEETLKTRHSPVYCFREIVHNRYVVDSFRKRGVQFVENISEIPRGSIVIFSAHGVAPEVRRQAEERELTIIDATCPFVNKVHAEVKNYAADGYTILLIGHRKHDEVIGVSGEAPESIRVIENREEAENIEVEDPTRVAVVTQTTLSVSETEHIMEKLKKRFPLLKTPSTSDICYATQHRQQAVLELVGKCDLILVLGAVNSSNTNRLVEVARAANCRAVLVSYLAEVEKLDLTGISTVGVTAGASTPEEFVEKTVNYLKAFGTPVIEETAEMDEEMHFSLPPWIKPPFKR